MGDLLGNAVRFGVANDVLAAGEGIETMLSLRCVLPTLPMAAALSANHLAAMLLPLTLRRLYIARDADAAGDAAVAALTERAEAAGIEAIALSPTARRLQRGSAHASASTSFGQPCASSSRRRTSSASCCGRRPRRDERRRFERRHGRSGEAHDAGQSRAHGLLEGDRTAGGPARQWLRPAIFRRPCGAFASRNKIAGLRHPPLALRPSAALRVLVRSARRLVIATKAAMGAADPAKDLTMTTDHDDTEFEPPHSSSPTDHVLNELQLYGYRPFHDEPDPRPLPEGKMPSPAPSPTSSTPWSSTLSDTRLEPDLEDLLWSTVNLFHRATDRIERELDDNEQAQQQEPARAGRLGGAVGRTRAPHGRGHHADRTPQQPGTLPRPGRRTVRGPHRLVLAAALGIDGQPSHADRGNDRQPRFPRRQDAAPRPRCMLPAGPKIALTGGLDFNDHRLIWDRLDKVHAKHPDMVLLHGGSPKGAELIAAKWATNRKVPQIAFKPDWTKHAKAAPFKRNDAMLEVLPIGVMVFPGTGIQDNLADKAKKLGIPVWKFGSGGA